MSIPPLLLDASRLRHRPDASRLRRSLLDGEFGRLGLDAAGDSASCLPLSEAVCPEPLRPEWRRGIAEELLLARSCGRQPPEAWRAAFADVSPFGNAVKLSDCWDLASACAVFPLAGQPGPGVGHVWVIAGLRHRDRIAGVEVLPGEFGVCCVVTESVWQGRSWQLAGRLAARCLSESLPARADPVRALACRWIITGRVEGDRTVAVTLGNKLELPTRRDWLMPLENMGQASGLVPEGMRPPRIRSAVDENCAWGHITGQGLQNAGELPWPASVQALHILIGGNIKAAVVSGLFCGPGTEVQLWHSAHEENSRRPAEAALIVLKTLRPDLVLQPLRELSSTCLVEAERTLREAIAEYGAKPLLLNVTSGNFLMRLAADAVSRRYPNAVQVYRDVDAPPRVFTRIDYQRYPHESGTYRGREEALRGLDSGFLFGVGPPAGGAAAEAIAAEFLARCRGHACDEA